MITVHNLSDEEQGESTYDYHFTHPVDLPKDQKKPSEDVVICRKRITNYGVIKLYALINGFRNGITISKFVGSQLIERILHNDLICETDPNEDDATFDTMVKKVIHEAFIQTDADYFREHIDGTIATMYQIKAAAQDMTEENVEKLYEANNKISSGAVVVLALIINDRLYVANTGNSIAILVKQGDDSTDLNAFQISELHEGHEVKETRRLESIGVNFMLVEGPSRCFGDHFRKGGFKENQRFARATSEPVIVEPTVFGGIKIDKNYCFILFLSPSLCQAIMKVKKERKLSEHISQMLINKINDANRINGSVKATLEAIADDLKMEVEHKHCQVPEYGLSLMYFPLNDNVLDLVNPVDGTDRSIKTQNTSPGYIDSYVDFSDYFLQTPQAEDLRTSIIGRVESIKQLYRDSRRDLQSITEFNEN